MNEQIKPITDDQVSFIAMRHSIKPEGEDTNSLEYPGISEKGVEKARQEAKNWLEMIRKSPEGSVIFLGGTSEQIRTKSTMRALVNEMKTIMAEEGNEDILVITEDDIADSKASYKEKLDKIMDIVKLNPTKKIVVSSPLSINEFGTDGWLDETGTYSAYTQALLKATNNEDDASLIEWFKNEGRLGDLVGPNPTDVAKTYLVGIRKLARFANSAFDERGLERRPLTIGVVGHSRNLDALAVYLANNGKVNLEGLEKVGGTMIKEMEPIILTNNESGLTLKYGDRLELPLEEMPNTRE